MKLNRLFCFWACCAGLALLPVWSVAQSGATAKPSMAAVGSPMAPAESLSALFSQLSGEVIGAAQAMPADKYDFAPTAPGDFKGVRTFGEQVRHIAQANYQFFKGWGINGEVDPKTLSSLKTKDELLKALRDSFAFEQAAINSVTPENGFNAAGGPPEFKLTRVSMVSFAMAHAMDHYGQMVEYLRMNGIIPPASRKQ